MEAATQIVTLVLAVLAIIWHQQRTTDKLRDEFNSAIASLRDEFNTAIASLRDAVVGNGQRIARIEGFLRIGMPADVGAPEPSSAEPPVPSSSSATDPAIEPAAGA